MRITSDTKDRRRQPPVSRPPARFPLWSALIACLLSTAIAGNVTFAQDEQLATFIADLGSDDYETRSIAAEKLILAGEAAEPLLRKALQSGDSEVRLLTRRILAGIEQQHLEHQLDGFLAGEIDTLPGWPEFSEIAGDDEPARELYAKMYKPHHALLNSIRDGHWHPVPELELARTQVFLNSGALTIQQLYKSVTAAFLMTIESPESLESSPDVQRRQLNLLTTMSNARLFSFATSSRFAPNFRRIFARWIHTLPPDDDRIESLIVMSAAKLNLRGLSARLIDVASNRERSTRLRSQALNALSVCGSESDIPAIVQLIENDDVAARFHPEDKGGNPSTVKIDMVDGIVELVPAIETATLTEVRLGDVALLASILLSEQSPETFGFAVRPGPDGDVTNRFMLRDAGFRDPELRNRARELWKQSRAQTGSVDSTSAEDRR